MAEGKAEKLSITGAEMWLLLHAGIAPILWVVVPNAYGYAASFALIVLVVLTRDSRAMIRRFPFFGYWMAVSFLVTAIFPNPFLFLFSIVIFYSFVLSKFKITL